MVLVCWLRGWLSDILLFWVWTMSLCQGPWWVAMVAEGEMARVNLTEGYENPNRDL